MSDDFEPTINFLAPDLPSPEVEAAFEAPEKDSATKLSPTEVTPQARLRPAMTALSAAVSQSVSAPDKDPILLEIENILSQNLLEIYQQLPENKREAFKLQGEDVASKIHEMIITAKVKIHKVLKLLTDWLKVVPGINTYFLQQEAKIKLDKLMDYADAQIKLANEKV